MGAQKRREALQRGFDAEGYVARRLGESGWQLLERNWRGRGGEIDLIVRRNKSLRFVEVKARSNDDSGLEAIGAAKRSKLIRAAEAYLLDRDDFDEACFLVALVDLAAEPWSIELIDNAFDGV